MFCGPHGTVSMESTLHSWLWTAQLYIHLGELGGEPPWHPGKPGVDPLGTFGNLAF